MGLLVAGGEVDDLVDVGRTRVVEYPRPAGFGVTEALRGTAFAAGEPCAGADRDYVDHLSRVAFARLAVSARPSQRVVPRME